MRRVRALWRRLTAVHGREEDAAQDELVAKEVAVLAGLAALVSGVVLLAGIVAVGMFRWSDVVLTLTIGAAMAVTWWLADVGRARLAIAIPGLVILLPGVYGSLHHGPRTVMVLYYALSILLSGALLGHGAQWAMFALSSALYITLGWRQTGTASPEFVNTLVASLAGWLGITLFQSFSTGRLRKALGQTRATAGRLAAEVAQRECVEQESLRLNQFLSLIIDSAEIWLHVRDQDDNLLVWNRAAELISGYDRDQVIGRNDFENLLYPDPEYRRQIQAESMRSLDDTGKLVDMRTPICCRDGKTRTILWNCRNLHDRQGRYLGSVSLGQDVTEREQQEEALRQAQKLESIGLLAGGIAHDFNNLLAAMLGQSSLALLHLPPGHPARQPVEKSVRAAERAAELTRQLLAYAGKGQFEIAAVDLSALVQGSLDLLTIAVPAQIEIELTPGDDLPPVEGDPSQLQQVLMNLAINAAEAIPEGRAGRVTIATGMLTMPPGQCAEGYAGLGVPGAGEYVYLEVADNGAGMAPAVQARIFEPFFSTKFAGRGLGLAAVLGIVRRHHGTLCVRSRPGEGSVFRVLLPAASGREDHSHGAGEQPAMGGRPLEPAGMDVSMVNGVGAGEKPLKVLVIDDEEPVREAVIDIMELAGLETLPAADGRTGVEVYAQRHDEIGVVLLDLLMPGMSGEETLAALRAVDPQVHVILSSGFDEGEAMRRIGDGAPDQPAVVFLQKPYDLQALIAVVKRQLDFV